MIRRSLLRQSQTLYATSRYIDTFSPVSSALPVSHKRSQFVSLRIRSLQRSIAVRYFSSTDTPQDGANTDAAAVNASQSEIRTNDSVNEDLESKDKEIIDLKDRYLRSVADFRNLQERTKRDVQSARDFAISRFAQDLVESIDNLDRALGTVPSEKLGQAESNKELENLYDGLKMTEKILMQTLKKHGLERFDPSENGEQFNPYLHEATFQTPVEGKDHGSVFMTQQKGFMLNGRVIRAAKVGVVKNS